MRERVRKKGRKRERKSEPVILERKEIGSICLLVRLLANCLFLLSFSFLFSFSLFPSFNFCFEFASLHVSFFNSIIASETFSFRGASREVLAEIKQIVSFCVVLAYHLRLEVAYYCDRFAQLPLVVEKDDFRLGLKLLNCHFN